jgi:hypothetical protein
VESDEAFPLDDEDLATGAGEGAGNGQPHDSGSHHGDVRIERRGFVGCCHGAARYQGAALGRAADSPPRRETCPSDP